MIGLWWIIILRGEHWWQGGCCSGFREFSISFMRLQCQDSSASTRGVLACPTSCISLEWRKSEVRPGLPGMLCCACQQDSSSPPSQSLQWFGQQGIQRSLQEHSCSWVQWGPWFTPGLSQGAQVLELLNTPWRKSQMSFSPFGCLACSFKVCPHSIPCGGRGQVFIEVSGQENGAVWDSSSRCNVGWALHLNAAMASITEASGAKAEGNGVCFLTQSWLKAAWLGLACVTKGLSACLPWAREAELSDGIRAGLQPATYFLAATRGSGEAVRNCSAELWESLLWRLCLPNSAKAAEAGWY